MNKFVQKLYDFAHDNGINITFKDNESFKINHNGEEHHIQWEEESLYTIDVVDGDFDWAGEVDLYELERMMPETKRKDFICRQCNTELDSSDLVNGKCPNCVNDEDVFLNDDEN